MWVYRSFKRIFQRYSQDKKGSLGFFVAEPEKLKFDYVPKKKETAKKNMDVQTEDKKDSLAVFSTAMILPMPGEMS